MPYVSFVAASRNDDHGGHLLRRMQVFVEALLAGCEAQRLDAELVLLEWNPPADRPRLAEAIRWPRAGSCAVRIVEVSPELHRRYPHAEALPLHQMIAKNAGIRRARGSFIVATNVDVLFSDELLAVLAARGLDPGSLYRTDRHDVAAEVPAGTTRAEQLAFCRNNVLRVHQRDGTLDTRSGVFSRIYRPLWQLEAARLVAPLAFLPFLAEPLRNARESLSFIREFGPLHTNASGDFTMMARERWHALTGYWEFPGFPAYVDGLLCYAAKFSGLAERLLPDSARVYHMEHDQGFGEYASGAFWGRLESLGVPRVTREAYVAMLTDIKAGRAPPARNGPDWGLGGEALPEHRPAA
jgi:hypothetical protein